MSKSIKTNLDEIAAEVAALIEKEPPGVARSGLKAFGAKIETLYPYFVQYVTKQRSKKKTTVAKTATEDGK